MTPETLVSTIFRQVQRSEDGTLTSRSLHTLGYIQSNLGILWWTTDRDIRIGRRLQCAQPTSNNKGSTTEASKRLINARGPIHQCADAIDHQASHESHFVAPAPEDVPAEGEGGEEICSAGGTDLSD